jgi:hypothetical protein
VKTEAEGLCDVHFERIQREKNTFLQNPHQNLLRWISGEYLSEALQEALRGEDVGEISEESFEEGFHQF